MILCYRFRSGHLKWWRSSTVGRLFVSLVAAALLLVATVSPAALQAQQAPAFPGVAEVDVRIPDEARQWVPESELVAMVHEFALWRTGEMFARVEAVNEVLTPLFQQMREAAGVQLTLPDTSLFLSKARAELDAVGRSGTVGEAQEHLQTLARMALDLPNLYAGLQAAAGPLQQTLQQKGKEMQAKVTALLQQEAAQMEADIRGRLEAKARAEAAKLQGEIGGRVGSYVAGLVAQAGRDPAALANIASQAQTYGAQLGAQMQADLQRAMEQEAQAAQQEAQQRLQARLDELLGSEGRALQSIGELAADVDQRIEAAAQRKLAEYDGYRQRALDHVRAIIQRIVKAQLDSAGELIRRGAPAPGTIPSGVDVPDRDALLVRLEQDQRALETLLARADSHESIAEAAAAIQARWKALQKDLERMKVQQARQAADEIKAKLDQSRATAQLTDGLQRVDQGIQTLEKMRKDKGKLEAKQEQTLKKLQALKRELTEGNSLLQEFYREAAKPDAQLDLPKLLDVKDRLQAKLEAIDRAIKEQSLALTAGVFIEAESESSAQLLPRDVEWASAKEIKPSWRPKPISGDADWYLSRGGETLAYLFTAPADGLYNLWVRDLDDGKHRPTARTITITMDGKKLGDFLPNAVLIGQWRWHKVGVVELKVGGHQMNVVKTATTSAAAHLDAFYLTTDPNEVPSEQVPGGPVTIVRACSSGLLQSYTDCDTGQKIQRSAMAAGSNRFAVAADGRSFDGRIVGGSGDYQITVYLSNGESLPVAVYPAGATTVKLTSEATNKGWTSSGTKIYTPK